MKESFRKYIEIGEWMETISLWKPWDLVAKLSPEVISV